MAVTPVEVRHLQLASGMFGFSRTAVRKALDEVADSFETVWRDRAGLLDRVEALETDLARHTELESVLRATLVSAERAAQDLKEQARREAELIVAEAHGEARRVTRDAATERERLGADIVRVRALLRSSLEVVEEAWEQPRAEAVVRSLTG
ncbi:MAG: DivIVA domain-containing protein [Thermoleophilia bacterium]|nr:DivIVA domain-containing protein [Thermoleophilia bacterium]